MADPCPVTKLTKAEKDAVANSWAALKQDWKTIGADFFVKLFETYPNIKAYFKSFDNMDMSEIKQSPKLRAHSINFCHGLNSFIQSLDEPDVLVILVQKLTVNHFRRKIAVDRFQEAFALYVSYAQDHAKFDDFTAAAWTKTLKVVADVIGGHMQTLQKSGGE
uniref:Globin n=1 Tax=Spisula solidissima TaxID=6584 RepID=Q3MQ26_SPISO|nr:Chain A, Nerve hemoglobin [Spisula solidissima]8OUP_B Chain B, Nerve hemoglobin [Spisula solidissima]8OUP_C Chain C, Nerve hemoglobin [Spisula solidissima]8OUP_D Chain D, Nerve hemoglobin [Spisula solidissima]CAJ31107.1 nerve hemoglobin [Spisula solidissima]CAJ31108.1 nerve hemoglobin [Spisula solidissima]